MSGRVLVAVAFGLLATRVWAADEAAVLRLRAEQLAAQDHCEEALPRAQRARELAPNDARAALVIGRCDLRMGRYQDAIEPLEAARRLDPSLEGVSTDLAQVHYHLDQLEQADQELDRALESNPDDARALLYRGLVLLRRAENKRAAEVLDRASRLDRRVSPAASYYSGLAWEYARDRDRAAEALERARAADPNGEWGREAGRALERVDEPYRRHVWAHLRGGLEYDSNVPLQTSKTVASGLVPPAPGVRNGDARGAFDAQVGVELFRNPEWSAGVIAGYDGTAQFDLREFNLQYPWLSVWLDHRFDDKTWLRLEPFGGYEWFETDSFLAHGGAQLSLDRTLADALTARVFARYNYNDFLYRIPDDPVLTNPQVVMLLPVLAPAINAQVKRARNRDGSELDAGGDLQLAIAATETRLRAGANYEYYDSTGRDWTYDGVYTWVELEQELPAKFRLDGSASYAHRLFRYPSSYLPPLQYFFDGSRRRDDAWEFEAGLERPITPYAKLSARYSYTKNVSNTDVYDYDRHIVGGFITFSWSD